MKVDKTEIEVTITQQGFVVTLSPREMKLLQAALGKVDFEEARAYVLDRWPSDFKAQAGVNDNAINNELYKLYTEFYDVQS